MAMGSTGTINISAKMITDIKAAVEDYRSKAKTLSSDLKNKVDGLIPSYFSGAAADGFKEFYNKNIVTVVGDGSTTDDALTKLLKTIDDMADNVLKALPGSEGVDDKLAEENKK